MQTTGLQLYTLRDQLGQDFLGTLDQVAATGVRTVELAQEYGGLSADALRGALDERQLQAGSAHLPLAPFEDDFAGQLAFLQALGLRHVVYPYHRAETEAEWVQLADRLEAVALRLAGHGLTLSYHNHDHELSQTVRGQPVLDLLLERAPTLQAELDVAWIYAGGQDPVAYLRRYAGRTPLVHLKDVRREGQGWQTVALGEGEVPLQEVLAAVPQDAQTFYEQDQGGSIETLRRSLAYLAE
ncbi:sugar phosphate isomerase/epimerase family protein [Deinococcus sp. UYEF24]